MLGQLRRSATGAGAPDDAMGLSRLGALWDAVTVAGAAVTVTIERRAVAAVADATIRRTGSCRSPDHVLRDAGPGAAAQVCLRYEPDALALTVTETARPARPTRTMATHRRRQHGRRRHGGHGTGGHGTGGHGTGGHDTGGHGLRGMRERAAAAGGELTAPLPDVASALRLGCPPRRRAWQRHEILQRHQILQRHLALPGTWHDPAACTARHRASPRHRRPPRTGTAPAPVARGEAS